MKAIYILSFVLLSCSHFTSSSKTLKRSDRQIEITELGVLDDNPQLSQTLLTHKKRLKITKGSLDSDYEALLGKSSIEFNKMGIQGLLVKDSNIAVILYGNYKIKVGDDIKVIKDIFPDSSNQVSFNKTEGSFTKHYGQNQDLAISFVFNRTDNKLVRIIESYK
ncbi:MAG: hypothetical protein H6621_07565 [Halobacteriovoraceae bacterium]|nr:hypothetical protein [Halobacteriovoraceae bacterium]